MTKPSIFDNYSNNYADVHSQYLPTGISHDQFRIQKARWVISILDEVRGTAPEVLDFGCNSGELILDLVRLRPDLVIAGIDESAQALTVARESFKPLPNQPRLFGAMDELPENEQYHLITVFNVLHHVDVSLRAQILAALKARLKPGGRLLIWEHNRWNPLTRYLVKICPFDEGVTLVSKRWLRSALQECGLDIESFEYVNLLPPSLHRFVFFAWLERIFRKFPLGAQYRLKVMIGTS